MANFLEDNDDLRFYLERGIDWEPLVAVTEREGDEEGFSSTEEAVAFYRDIASLVADFAEQEIAPHWEEIDRGGVRYENGEVVFPDRLEGIFAKLKELELHGMNLPRELGGQNCPMMLYFLNIELIARADVSVVAHHSFHGGIAMAMLAFSIREGSTRFQRDPMRIESTRWQEGIGEIARGEAWGCMDITEPGAGSDMAAIRTVGEQDADGNWFVSGQKIFITSGHGKHHFVIARTEEAGDADDPFAGLGGLSMFLVKAYDDLPDGTRKRYVGLDRVEEKMGHHASATCSLNFDRSPADLVGKRGEGFRYMLDLMNNARLGVGFECLGLCEAAYREAKAYAAERMSMGKTLDQHELIADALDEMRTDIQGIRALGVTGAVHEELARKKELLLEAGLVSGDSIEGKRLAGDIRQHKATARRITPVLKFLAAEKAVEIARRAVQMLGGNGYTKDYPAEKLLRDAVVMPIYEGTSQIQALMATKDCLIGIVRNPQEFAKRRAQATWRSLRARDPLARRVAKLSVLSTSAQQHLMVKTAGRKARGLTDKPITEWPKAFLKDWDPKRDFAYALLHSERLIRLLADEAIAEILWDQALEHPERRELLERHLERAEPRARALVDEITTTGERLLASLTSDASGQTQAA